MMLSLLRNGLVAFLILLPNVGYTYELPSTHWVQDPQHLLAPAFHQKLGRLLHSAYQSGDVYIHLLVINQPEQPLKDAILHQKVHWDAQFPELQTKTKVVYVGLNIATQESLLLLGQQCRRGESLMTGFKNIHQHILSAHLQSGAPERACLESIIALITLFEDWVFLRHPAAPQTSVDWLVAMKWGSWLAILASFGFVFRDKFRPTGRSLGLNGEQGVLR